MINLLMHVVYRITKYGSSDRSSQEKTMHKPVAHHLNNTGKCLKIKTLIE